MKKYSVIGGQYNRVKYGESDSLLSAKRLATKNCEYWDNWQGWHTPTVYLTEDVLLYGIAADPVCTYNNYTKRWEEYRENH